LIPTRHEVFRRKLKKRFGNETEPQVKVAIMTLIELSEIKERLDKLEAVK